MRLKFLWPLLLVLILGACAPVNDPANPKNVGTATKTEMVEYDNGVYYIEAEGSDFGNALSFLSAKYPGQTITFSPGRINEKGRILGYFIRVAPEKCEAKTVAPE